MRYQFITRFLNRCLPASLDRRLGNKSELKIRARILTGLYLASAITVLASGVLFCMLHLFTDHDFFVAILCILAAAIVLFAEIGMFYWLGNITASAIFFSMTFFGVTLGITIFTGGWDSPVRQLFFCAPMISFLVGGRHEGLYISFLTLVIGIVMLGANYTGFQIFQIIKAENIPIANVVLWVVSINLLVSCLAVYDAILESYSQIEAELSSYRSLRQKSS